MTDLPFHKVVGSGNDFILLDARRRPFPKTPSQWAKIWCDRKQGVGADGLLLVTGSRKADARMRIFNPDGSEAAMCGNGLRCVAWYLHTQDHGKQSLTIETGAGILEARIVSKERVQVLLKTPSNLRLGLSILFQGKRYHLHAVDTGVPHAVVLTPDRKRIDLASFGRFVRFHQLFQPNGTNVDLMEIASPSRIAVRTYERGVEGETLACGTGAAASAVIGVALGKLRSPIQVMTAGGEKLIVRLKEKQVSLEGPAKVLFQGRFLIS